MSGRHSRRRDPGRVIIAPAATEQQALMLAAAYRHVLRDLLVSDRSRVDMDRGPDGYLMTVSYAPGPARISTRRRPPRLPATTSATRTARCRRTRPST
jgi:hypothetical protein